MSSRNARKLASFDGTDWRQPEGSLVEGGNGILYGVTSKANLKAAGAWRRMDGPMTTNAGSICIILELGGEGQFFRLVRR